MMRRLIIISLCLIVIASDIAFAQSSVAALLRSNLQLGKQYFQQGDYEKALQYFELVNTNKIDRETQLKIARSLFFVKRYHDAAKAYSKISAVNPLTMPDQLYYAELNTSIGNYSGALQSYKDILNEKPDDPLLLQKIWQLDNVYLFFEDSLHYSVRRLSMNSPYAELSPVLFRHGIVFLSDRKEIDFKNPDHDKSAEVFNLYYAEMERDTTLPGFNTKYRAPVNFSRNFYRIAGIGPVSFYADDMKCVLTGFSTEVSSDGTFKKQLFFSELKNGRWTTPTAFEHNNKEYNITEPSITPDGGTLVFSSDRPGGFGGADIYRCERTGEKWSAPLNLGEHINTSGNESFPFVYYNTLYFSSDGHPGLGGLDIFSTILIEGNDHDIKNLGYPINSGGDDFGFVLRTGSHGYLSSNRKNGGYDDDLYEFEMDFRTYPFEISGVIRLSERTDSTIHRPMAGANIELVDYMRGQVVARTQADTHGGFSVSIPWFSKFVLRLSDQENEPYIVSIEINRESSENSNYEIVVIKRSLDGGQKTYFEGD